ncbi:SinI family autotransporter-associated protein [Pseudocitrobacter cyperus]|uniref:SinI family autotransporter-associated protein n=1 Tax=Pseudocitrobacter cyperus TaxID=3112843 RepID=A0ABV0HQ87_9ENTR
MKQETKRGLTKIALALMLAGYCAVPAALAANESGGNLRSGQWTSITETTGTLQGTVPWINRSSTETAVGDKDHVTVTIDRGTRSPVTSDSDKQFHIGDTVTVNWSVGDTEGDADNGANNTGTLNDLTKATIIWTRSDSQDGTPVEIGGSEGKTSYTITDADADKYIGIKITPTTSTGDPNVGTQIILKDLSTNAGGGSDSDDIPEGPVVDNKLNVVIYKEGTQTNLLGTSTKIDVNTTYKVLLWSDKNGNDTYDAGEDVTANYNYRWKFTGTSAQLHTAGGIVNSSFNNNDLVIPQTNAEAKTAFDNASGNLTLGADGVQGYGLTIDYQRK